MVFKFREILIVSTFVQLLPLRKFLLPSFLKYGKWILEATTVPFSTLVVTIAVIERRFSIGDLDDGDIKSRCVIFERLLEVQSPSNKNILVLRCQVQETKHSVTSMSVHTHLRAETHNSDRKEEKPPWKHYEYYHGQEEKA